ncbi:MAG TPA: sulfatase-like hydrolase/transferase [Phycisphaerae bacterium]|nr:sulfatase-like hydrolase/transferase [Phycisphaerae bacterium]HUU22446.1 sulfatase-like hydrolase/transferase [Phycisphaerae bacterium]
MPDRPNVVIVMTDQQRADHCAREGFALDTTPLLDSLARSGAWFDRAWTASPSCLPARVSMLTGRLPSATGVRCNQNARPPRYEKDLPAVLAELGYRTALCGKNHSHARADRWDYYSPYGHSAGHGRDDRTEQEAAFDEYLAGLCHRADYEPAPFPVECQGPCRATRDAMRWIDTLGGEPFFLWLTFAEPHNPYQVPEPYFSMFPPESLPPTRSGPEAWQDRGFKWRFTKQLGRRGFADYDRQVPRARANYCGMLRLIDDQVRRFVEFLDARGLREETILVFVSDHGDFVGEYGLVRKGPEMPECLMRIPMLWTGPGIVGNERPHEAHVSLVDVFPTICEAVGAPLPAGVQGRSLWPLLTGGEYPRAEFESVYGEQGMGGLHYEEGDGLVDPTADGLHPSISFDCLNSRSQSGTMRAVRKGDWKLIFDMQGRGQLYDLAADPVELANLFGRPEHAAKQQELLADLLAWTIRTADPLPLPDHRYVVKTDPRNWWAGYR